MSYIQLSLWDLAAASLFVLLNGILSLCLSLGIARQLLVAATRMVVQLAIVGAALSFLFATVSLPWTLAWAAAMVAIAGREIAVRPDRRLSGWWGYGLGTAGMAMSAGSLTLVALLGSLQPDPWYDPRYAIPLFGMILGNTMTGVSLAIDSLTSAVLSDRRAIEARIALGADRMAALRPVLQTAVRRGLTPMINAMAVTGLVSLPGMMTGQILAGVPPGEAVRYQLLIMFLIAGATGLGVLLSVLACAWRLTDARHRLRCDRLAL